MKLVKLLKKTFIATLLGVFATAAWAKDTNHEMGFYVMPGIYTANVVSHSWDGDIKISNLHKNEAMYYALKGAKVGGSIANPNFSKFNTAGGLYYTYAPKGGFGYRLDLAAMAFIPAYDKNTKEFYKHIPMPFVQLDNTFFWDLVPKEMDFLKFDLGFAIRLYTGGIMIQPTLYYDLDANIPDTGIHFNFTGNIGTLDIHNSDVKLSTAFEFGSNVKWGLELGYKYFGRSFSLGFHLYQKEMGMHTGFVAMYLKM